MHATILSTGEHVLRRAFGIVGDVDRTSVSIECCMEITSKLGALQGHHGCYFAHAETEEA